VLQSILSLGFTSSAPSHPGLFADFIAGRRSPSEQRLGAIFDLPTVGANFSRQATIRERIMACARVASGPHGVLFASKHSVCESAHVETNPPISPLGSSLLVRANEGRTLHAFGHAVVILLDGKQTDGKFTAFLNISPPGGGPRPHYHEREDEWFYIVEGRVSFFD
jgi:mannose-6-phosphate isomerase-like protein (cupin superfamily)